MKILHINSYYIDNHLYSTLYTHLNSFVEQKVYIPIKHNRKPEFEVNLDNTQLFFSQTIGPWHKYNYFNKIKKLTKSIEDLDLQHHPNIIHAHNLFTDGAIAYELKKKYNVKYIIAIRLTDVNLQYKFMYNRRSYAHKIMDEAESIIFVSPVYKHKFYKMLPNKFIEKIDHKTLVIPNGINNFWLENKSEKKDNYSESIELLFVGRIIDIKNLFKLIDATEILNKDNNGKFKLTIVGGQSSYEKEYFKKFLKCISNKNWINYLGKINDPERLRELYKNTDIFVMPSKQELFGLTYIEALSQSTPILYSKDEGISAFISGKKLGVGVDPNITTSIAEGISKIAKNKNEYYGYHDFVSNFDWNHISKQYIKLYNKI